MSTLPASNAWDRAVENGVVRAVSGAAIASGATSTSTKGAAAPKGFSLFYGDMVRTHHERQR